MPTAGRLNHHRFGDKSQPIERLCSVDRKPKGLEQVLQQVVGEAGRGVDAVHDASDQAPLPGVTGAAIGIGASFPIETNAHRGTRRTCMFLNDATGLPPRVAGL